MKRIDVRKNGKNIGFCTSFTVDKDVRCIELDNFIDIRAMKSLQKYSDIITSWAETIEETDVIDATITKNFILNLVAEMNEDLNELN